MKPNVKKTKAESLRDAINKTRVDHWKSIANTYAKSLGLSGPNILSYENNIKSS